MNKKLTAKIQKIQPDLPASLKSFSGCFSVEPETKEILLKKGTIYGVYNITSDTDLDITLTTKMFLDVLHDSYFESETVSPIQSLEKALMIAKEKLSKDGEAFDISCTSSVLWGNVLYIVQMGAGETYLMRDNDTRKINALKEGNFASTSGVIKADDVIVLCTEEFSKKYTPQKLLTTTVESRDLEFSESGMILKFVVDLSFSSEEVVNFAVPAVKAKKQNPIMSALAKLKSRKTVKEPKVVTEQPHPETVQPQVQEVPAVSVPSTPKIPLGPQKSGINLMPTTRSAFVTKKSIVAMIVIGLIVLAISGIFFAKSRNQPDPETVATQTPEVPQTTETTEEAPADPDADTSADVANKVNRVEATPFYDLKIADQNAKPSEISMFGTTIYTSDPTTGIIYTSSTATAKFTALGTSYAGIRSLHPVDAGLSFVDTEGYKVIDANGEVAETYEQTGLEATKSYLTNVYAITDGVLNKYSKSNSTLTPTLWAESPDFNGAKDMEIAISIFAITQNGGLVKYTTGEKDTFTLTGVPDSLGALCCIWTSLDSDNIYVADPANKRIVVIDKEGAFVGQYKHLKENDWTEIKDFYIDEEGGRGVVLSGSKVYLFDLGTFSE